MFPASFPEPRIDVDLSHLGEADPPAFCLRVIDGCVAFGIWVCDRDGGVVHVSRSFLEMIGMGLAECRASGWIVRLPADEASLAADKWRRCLKDGNAWEHQFRIRTAEGRLKHILSRGVPVPDARGVISAWVGVHFDISEIKEAEEELRQSQERFRVALESGCDLLYECESATGTRRWFGPVDEILGYGREDFPRTESAWEQSLHPDDREAVLRARERHLEGRSPFHVEYRVRRKDGEFVHWLDRGKAMRDKDGLPQFWIGFVTDMTDRRRSEDMLRKGEERRRVSQRLEVIGRLAGGIAHDFNNLLTAINGYSELVLGELGKDNPLAPQVSEILRAGEKAAMLTRQLLAFSRRQVLAPKIMDLNSVIGEMRKLIADFMGGSVRVHYQPGSGLARISADPSQVEQVLLNIALNAKDAMPQGGELFIETANAVIGPGVLPPDPLEGEPRQGAYALLSVRDTGVGMDEDTKAHLFEPFFTTKGRAQGLGLSAVYGIIKQSGGYISVTSQKGQGTMIRLYWPDAEAAQPMAPPDAPKPGHGPLILVAEDDELQRMLIREMLEGRGFSVMLAGSGNEALEIARRVSDPIDLLLADVMMPGMDGLELAYTLNISRPEIKILFMSGYTDYLQVRRGVLEAHLAFIGKPFSARDLLAKIDEVLAERHVIT